MSTKGKLMASGKLEVYGEVFDYWLNLGIIEKILQGKIGGVHYLPHRPVIKAGSTTSIRPVFNASSHVLGSPSLNNCLSTGPNLIEIIPTILNRFRRKLVLRQILKKLSFKYRLGKKIVIIYVPYGWGKMTWSVLRCIGIEEWFLG
ncbi:DUF1758 domain-containing protein [Trichonephila clavipes]|nr:DUF1758 domain-containing protein [Trichonephila clavipes]